MSVGHFKKSCFEKRSYWSFLIWSKITPLKRAPLYLFFSLKTWPDGASFLCCGSDALMPQECSQVLMREVQKLQLTARVCPLKAPPPLLPPATPPMWHKEKPEFMCGHLFRWPRKQAGTNKDSGGRTKGGGVRQRWRPLLFSSMQEFKEKEIEVKWMSSSLLV